MNVLILFFFRRTKVGEFSGVGCLKSSGHLCAHSFHATGNLLRQAPEVVDSMKRKVAISQFSLPQVAWFLFSVVMTAELYEYRISDIQSPALFIWNVCYLRLNYDGNVALSACPVTWMESFVVLDDHGGPLGGDHHGGDIQVPSHNHGHHWCVDHAQSLNSSNPAVIKLSSKLWHRCF